MIIKFYQNSETKEMVFLFFNNLFQYLNFSINLIILFSFLREYLYFPSGIQKPYLYTLINGNTLLIYEQGIKLYDSSINQELGTIYNFN